MTEQVKQHTIKVLEFLKDFKDIDLMTLGAIQKDLISTKNFL